MSTPLHKVPAVAEQFGCCEATVRRWAEEGKIKAVRLGRRLLFEDAEIRRVIEQHRQPAERT